MSRNQIKSSSVDNSGQHIDMPGDQFAIDTAERRVIRQYLEALLFEKIVPFTVEGIALNEKNLAPVIDTIYKHCINFELGRLRFRAQGTVAAFDRVRLAPGTIEFYSVALGKWLEASINQIIDAQVLVEPTKARLKQELTQTLALCRWNDANLSRHKGNRRHLSFQDLESAIVEGHLYHPCFKTRTGFSERDHARYGPEAANVFQLQWLAIKRATVAANFPGDESDFWQHEIGSDGYQMLRKKMQTLGASWEHFTLLPIHPWQYREVLSLGLEQELHEKNIYDLGYAGDLYQASQSLRTLVNISNPKKANIKIPLNVICTSSHRNLQSHFVHTAPVISAWLQEMVAADDFLQKNNNTLLLSEYAGLLYEPGSAQQALSGRIGVIFRESVVDKLAGNQQALPFSALMLTESDGKPFIYHWLERFGAEAWVDQLLKTMLVPIWHMLAHNGVAFEAHSQNLLLIHRDGWPEKIVLRDFHEDSEFVAEFLQQPKNQPQLAAVDSYFNDIALNEGFAMDSVEALRALFMDTVFVFNLADLAFLLERTMQFDEAHFWGLVNKHLDAYATSGVTDINRIQRIAIGNQYIAVESLLKKKLMAGGALDYFEHNVENRLYQHSTAEQIAPSEA